MSFQEQACIAELYKPEADSGTEYLRDANDDIFWLLYGSVLVFNMQAGFALLEAGQVRIKNRSNMLLKNVVDVCMGGVVWYLFGYAFAFGLSSNGFIGGSWDVLSGCADYSKWMFQWTFATTSATIVSGAVAERCSFSAYLFMTFLMQGFLYPVVVHWVWSGYGWLGKDIIGGNGLMDFAGSGVVHLTGGTCALVGAVVVGPRAGRFSPDSLWPMRGNSVAFATLGTMTLWFSWYGFNCVSTGSYSAMYEASRVAMATTMSACGGGLAGLVLNLAHTGAPDILQALNGILGGLVAVTAGAPYYEPYVALAGGIVAGAIVFYCSWLLEALKIDDPVNASPVHMACGIWGLLEVGLLASPAYVDDPKHFGALYGGGAKQLGIQVLGAVAITLWATIVSGSVLSALKAAKILRVSFEDEIAGLDKLLSNGELVEDTTQQFQPQQYRYEHTSPTDGSRGREETDRCGDREN